MAGMKLVPADGDLLRQILDESHVIWNDGLSRRAYEQFNLAQLRTPWGSQHLRRMALLDDDGRLLTSAKRYNFRLRLDGRQISAVGIGAVYTPEHHRGHGHAPHLISELIEEARRDGAELAILFSEIGTEYYERLGFVPIPRHQSLMAVVEKPGAPMVLVRAAEDRDVPAVAALAATMAAPHRFALVPTPDTIRFSLAKKRLLAGLSDPGDLVVEFFIVEEGAGAVAFVILTTAGDDVVLEMCGDRDPAGARVGAMLQVLRARTPSEDALKLRGSLPPGWLPPQLRVVATAKSSEVLMVKPLRDGVLQRPLQEEDVLLWHGDLF
jgi:GNAT superfamily N-acetyltransferase